MNWNKVSIHPAIQQHLSYSQCRRVTNLSKSVSVLKEGVSQAIERLRNLTQISIQSNWHYWDGDLPSAQAVQPESWKDWEIADLNDRNHIAWSKGRNVRWLGQIITVPKDLQGYPLEGLCLRLALTWWAESVHIFVNGKWVQEGDLFDCSTRLLLSPGVTPGEEIAIALRLVSPGHDDGALVKSFCLYETSSPAHPPEPGFIADELAVLYQYLETFAPEKLELLAAAIAQIDWSILHTPHPNPSFNQSLAELRDRLLPLSNFLKQRKIYLLGHAHLDMAWLWTVDETWKAAERTFESVLLLQKDFPELIFCHSTPALYEWIEQNRPDLFHQIQHQIEAGKWEPIGGLWVEPELNIIGGEAIVRHILYGQRYFQEKFGSISPIAWLPDSFGFNWQLPQFLQQGSIEYFVTQKLRWNDTTQFPYDLFQWQAPDGTQILSLMSAPIGEGIDPVKMATYACDWEAKTGIPFTLWLPGVGDHGGGPTRDMLEVAQRWQQSPFFPKLEFTNGLAYLERVKQEVGAGWLESEVGRWESEGGSREVEAQNSKLKTQNSIPPTPLPTWNSDLYLEFHRGCYTTHGDQKWWNRRCEQWLYWAELYASLATIAVGTPYPKAKLETAWKQVLFNQFHDILPGSAIREVYEDADRAWRDAANQAIAITDEALKAIATQISLPPPPHPNARAVVVFNPCNWERSAIVNADISQELTSVETLTEFEEYEQNIFEDWQLCDLAGREVETPFCNFTKSADSYGWGLTFLAENIPALGYRCFWVYPRPAPRSRKPVETQYVLENKFLRVEIDPTTGNLSRIFDRLNQREVLNGAGNQLQAFRDAGQYWDAWNIDPNYEKHPLAPAELVRITSNMDTRMHNSLVKNVMVERRIGQSVFSQTYLLERESPVLKIQTAVDWKERHVLVKAAFPLNLEADYATYEIPCGVIQRTTRPGSDREKAQWEVPAIRWADLSDENYGVSLLSDCKHGYDAQPNQLRLTLLRGSEFPNPQADQGHHSFTCAIYPHMGNWKTAQTVKHGQELNMPLLAVIISVEKNSSNQTLPSEGSLLDLGAENLMLMSFKQAEDSPHEWILRCYECHGETAELRLQSNLNLKLKQPVDLLERLADIHEIEGQTVTVPPWKIASFKVSKG